MEEVPKAVVCDTLIPSGDTNRNVNTNSNINSADILRLIENAPQKTVPRYWHTDDEKKTIIQLSKNSSANKKSFNSPYKKVNPKETVTESILKVNVDSSKKPDHAKKVSITKSEIITPEDLETPEVLNISGAVVELESSDEDEVVEITLPPKPTITIESSDDEDIVSLETSPIKNNFEISSKPGSPREVLSSPVPSTVSSISDEFIKGDCIALNISSKRSATQSFDFSLHGSEFSDQNSPAKKRKKKKSKDNITKSPIVIISPEKSSSMDECFATPKSKAKRKKKKKSNMKPAVVINTENPDSRYTSVDKKNSYSVTNTSLPCVDVYETDSNQSEITNIEGTDDKSSNAENREINQEISNVVCSAVSIPKAVDNNTDHMDLDVIDLTDQNEINDLTIPEEIVLTNVTCGEESEQIQTSSIPCEKFPPHTYESTKVPQILHENLDFDNLNGKNTNRNMKYSMTALRNEMTKFYNESWGGENFNHKEIQRNMPRDKKLWLIDAKDRMPTPRKKQCSICNQYKHSDAACPRRPRVCHMCGDMGHLGNHCPNKICVNCGSSNNNFSTKCSRCFSWSRLRCAECGQFGHPISHCPDLWRRYHNTIDENTTLEESRQVKKHHQMYCSGCTRRGHLVHTCRSSQPFSGLPINSPYVSIYRPIYPPRPDRYFTEEHPLNKSYPQMGHANEQYKRKHSKSLSFEEPAAKKRNISESDHAESKNNRIVRMDKAEEIKDSSKTTEVDDTDIDSTKAPDYIPIISNNHDKKGHLIQDSEISDTSDIVTSARIYITNDVIKKLASVDGKEWLKTTSSKNNVLVQFSELDCFLTIKGKVEDQEIFHSNLRDWAKSKADNTQLNSENVVTDNPNTVKSDDFPCEQNIPKNKVIVLKKLNQSFEKLQNDFGNPHELYENLNQLQNNHRRLLKQNNVSPSKLAGNRALINSILKRLNIILIGQAGLGGGSTHLNELFNLQKKIVDLRANVVPQDLRKEIGQHYRYIFTALARDDYAELLKKYVVGKKNCIVTSVLAPDSDGTFQQIPTTRTVTFKKLNPFSLIKRNIIKSNNHEERSNNCAQKKTCAGTKNRLIFYRRKIMKTRPVDYNHKKMKLDLVRKLHSHIAHFAKNDNTTSKSTRRIRKTEALAQSFLNKL